MKRLFRCGCSILLLSLATSCDEQKTGEAGTNTPATPTEAGTNTPATPTAARKTPTRADLGVELGGLMETFGTTIASVSDQETWDTAKAVLQKNEARILAITAELQKLPLPSDAERKVSMQAMKINEAKLEQALGDKAAFMKRLPPGVASELSNVAGSFSSKMGEAQQALYGNSGR